MHFRFDSINLFRERKERDVSQKKQRSYKINVIKQFHDKNHHKLTKRQSTLSSQELCQSRSAYIMPRAALNNKGNWMYVVNIPEVDKRFTQLVKSEVCM